MKSAGFGSGGRPRIRIGATDGNELTIEADSIVECEQWTAALMRAAAVSPIAVADGVRRAKAEVNSHSQKAEPKVARLPRPESVAVSRPRGFFHCIATRFELQTEVENTGSIHMFAIAIVTNKLLFGPMRRWLAAFMSFCLVISQGFILSAVILEAANPPCVMHSDCRTGEYCSFWDYELSGSAASKPQCNDCASAIQMGRIWVLPYRSHEQANWTARMVCDRHLRDLQAFDDVDRPQTELFFDRSAFTAWGYDERSLRILCLSVRHCDETDALPSRCDHIAMSAGSMAQSTQLLLVFTAILLVGPLCKDMDDATIEEQVLDMRLHHTKYKGLELHCIQFVRLALRSRRFVLPVLTGVASVGVLVTSTLTASNILLNMLAVTFITEADDILATALLPLAARQLSNDMVDQISRVENNDAMRVPWLPIRARACLVITLIIVSVLFVEDLMKVSVLGENVAPCDGVLYLLLVIAQLGIFGGICLMLLGSVNCSLRCATCWPNLIASMRELTINFAAASMGIFSFFLSSRITGVSAQAMTTELGLLVSAGGTLLLGFNPCVLRLRCCASLNRGRLSLRSGRKRVVS